MSNSRQVVVRCRFDEEGTMRWLSALLLCGFLALAAAVAQQSPPSLAMQGEPTPPSTAARDFCPADQEIPFDDDSPFDPLGAEVGAADAVDVEQATVAALAPAPADGTATPAPYQGKLRMNFITLAPGTCTLGSHYYPAALIAVMSGQIEIFVEPGPDAPAGAPLPVAAIKRDGETPEFPDLSDDFTVSEDDWVSIQNRSIVGYRNNGPGYAQILVAGLYPAAPGGGGGCGGGCRTRG
jgi:hypothetical protein